MPYLRAGLREGGRDGRRHEILVHVRNFFRTRHPQGHAKATDREGGFHIWLDSGYGLNQVPAVLESEGTARFASLLLKTTVLSSRLKWGFPPCWASPRGAAPTGTGQRLQPKAPRAGLGSWLCRLGSKRVACVHLQDQAEPSAVTSHFISAPGKGSFSSVGAQEMAVPAALRGLSPWLPLLPKLDAATS